MSRLYKSLITDPNVIQPKPLRWTFWIACFAALVSGGDVCAQPDDRSPTPSITLDELLSRMREKDTARTAALRDYSSTRRYTLENRKFGTTAEMTVRMLYRHPGGKEFEVLSEQGPAIIRKRVLRKMMEAEIEAADQTKRAASQISPANYTFSLSGTAVHQGRNCYLLEIEPRTQNRFLIRGRIWLDQEDFAITRIEGSPAQNPSFWLRSTVVEHQYRKFGQFWLPVVNNSRTQARIFGHTEVKIEYLDYRINEIAPAETGNTYRSTDHSTAGILSRPSESEVSREHE